MTHYVCTGGCGGVATEPGVCQTNGCPKHQHPLIICHCEDGLHQEAYAAGAKVEVGQTESE